MVRQIENELKTEPYQRLSGKFSVCMYTSQFENSEILRAIQEEMSFAKFKEMKDNWLNNMRHEWLIMGHITEEDAR
jgi:secreted Zn-dependent insulinase-like peptidase